MSCNKERMNERELESLRNRKLSTTPLHKYIHPLLSFSFLHSSISISFLHHRLVYFVYFYLSISLTAITHSLASFFISLSILFITIIHSLNSSLLLSLFISFIIVTHSFNFFPHLSVYPFYSVQQFIHLTIFFIFSYLFHSSPELTHLPSSLTFPYPFYPLSMTHPPTQLWHLSGLFIPIFRLWPSILVLIPRKFPTYKRFPSSPLLLLPWITPGYYSELGCTTSPLLSSSRSLPCSFKQFCTSCCFAFVVSEDCLVPCSILAASCHFFMHSFALVFFF